MTRLRSLSVRIDLETNKSSEVQTLELQEDETTVEFAERVRLAIEEMSCVE